MSDPSEVLSVPPKGPSREDTQKSVFDKRPGHISWATDGANFSGCRAVTFTPAGVVGLTAEDEATLRQENDGVGCASAVSWMNLYFSKRANLLMLSMDVADEGITCLVTSQLDDEDLEEFQEIQQRVNLDMREWRERRAKDKQAAQESAVELRRLAAIGKKAEDHNLFEKLRKLEAGKQAE
jgi:hypothetical protein